MKNNIKFWSNIMLICAAAIWGSQIVFQKLATFEVGASSFYGSRCVCGVIIFSLIAAIGAVREKRNNTLDDTHSKPVYDKAYYKRLFSMAIPCVITNVLGNVMVQTGLAYVPAAKAAFLNAIYIIFVPVLGFLIFRKRTNIFTWLGTAIAVLGLYFLCMTEALTIEIGDLIILSATIFYAIHIQLVSKYVRIINGLHLSIVEFFFCAVICISIGIIFEDFTVTKLIAVLPNILYCGVGGIGICYTLQVTAQKYTDPTVAALLMSLESVFAAITGFIFLNERFTGREFLGIILIIISVVLAQLPPLDELKAKLAARKQHNKKPRLG